MSDGCGVGNKVDAEPFEVARVGSTPVGLLMGEHPHSRSDNRIYARFPSGRVEAFSGHRFPARIEIEETNYLKTSELSGDEVRKGGSCRIFLNGQIVYEFFTRDAQRALIKAYGLIDQLRGHSAIRELTDENVPPSDRLRGYKVYYRGVPAVCGHTMPDQGCVMIEPIPGHKFPPPVYSIEGDGPAGYDSDVKADILSPDIWWHRRTDGDSSATVESNM